jgi:hypothetical protein
MMPTIIHYIDRLEAFEPEVISVMASAYELALASFQPPVTKSVRESIASCIIGMARAGERDPHKLCERAVAARSVLVERDSAGVDLRVG